MITDHNKILFRFTCWFAFLNTILLGLVCYRYLLSLPWVHTAYLSAYGKKIVLAMSYLSYFAQFGLISSVAGVLLIPLLFVLPKRIFFVVAVTLYSFIVVMLVADSFIYNLYHFHLSYPIFEMILQAFTSHVFDLSWQENLAVSIVVISIFLMEIIVAYFLWQKIIVKNRWIGGSQWMAIIIGISIYFSYALIFYTSDSWINRVFVEVDRVFPLFSNVINIILPSKLAQRTTERYVIQPDQAQASLRYPVKPLQFAATKNKLNVVVIAVDTWRFDMVNENVMPWLSTFSKKSWYFSNHMSGGDSTGPGIFSLFYGLPSTYWTSMEKSKQGPLLIKQFLNENYQVNVISNAELSKPALDQTVFIDVKNIKVEDGLSAPPEIRDQAVTNDFIKMLNHRDNRKPFFTFLFYDAAHSYCQVKDMTGPFKPYINQCNRFKLSNDTDPKPYLNRYKNVLGLMDNQLKQVVTELTKENLLNNTVIIITGDHGEEFNDNHLNYWGHASNFTHYQVQTPLIVYWPGEMPTVFTHQTSHYDIAPTLLTRLFGSKSVPSDYSLGSNLLDKNPRQYLIVGSYIDLGIVQSDRITTIFPSGEIETDQLSGIRMNDKPNLALMKNVYMDLRRFYYR